MTESVGEVIRNIGCTFSVDDFGDVKGGLGKEKQKLNISFAKPVKDLKNERTDKAIGNGQEFEDEFTPWKAALLRIDFGVQLKVVGKRRSAQIRTQIRTPTKFGQISADQDTH